MLFAVDIWLEEPAVSWETQQLLCLFSYKKYSEKVILYCHMKENINYSDLDFDGTEHL